MLQANYIESLLDDRYFRPPSNAFALASTFFWVFLVEALFSQIKAAVFPWVTRIVPFLPLVQLVASQRNL